MSKKVLEEKLNSMFEEMIERLEKMESFTLEQLPLVCKEIIEERKTEIQNSAIIAGTSALLSFLGTVIFSILTFNKEFGDARILASIGLVIVGISLICCTEGLVSNLLSLRVLKVAPKLYVLRKLRALIL